MSAVILWSLIIGAIVHTFEIDFIIGMLIAGVSVGLCLILYVVFAAEPNNTFGTKSKKEDHGRDNDNFTF